MPNEVDVLIIGGGPVGLGLALELGGLGMSCEVIEQRTAPHRIPKGQNLTQRTLEHFYFWNIEKELRDARPLSRDIPIGLITTFGDFASEQWYEARDRASVNDYYYCRPDRLPQYDLERVLANAVAEQPNVTVRPGWKATSVQQDDEGVTVAIANVGERSNEAKPDSERLVRATYVVGCDGARSVVREHAAIRMEGTDHRQRMALAVFRSGEIDAHLSRYPARTTYLSLKPALRGYWEFLGRVDDDGRWFFHAPILEGDELTHEGMQRIVARALGAELDLEFDHVGAWNMRIQVADSYRDGRIFIAGDAAHTHPPYGGFGLNTGLEDVRNLGWKLAAVLQGWGYPELLDSYSAERQPVFRETGDWIGEGIEADREILAAVPEDESARAEFFETWQARESSGPDPLHYEPHYSSSPIVTGAPDGEVTGVRGTHELRARAGHHLAPVDLFPGANVYAALLDVPRGAFVLLELGSEDAGAGEPLSLAAAQLGIPFHVLEGSRETAAALGARYIVVRPDQFIAWCGDELPSDSTEFLLTFVGATSHARREVESRH